MPTANQRNVKHAENIATNSARSLYEVADIVRTLKATKATSQDALRQFAEELDKAALIVDTARHLIRDE